MTTLITVAVRESVRHV